MKNLDGDRDKRAHKPEDPDAKIKVDALQAGEDLDIELNDPIKRC
jgi:hypothetical protein